MLHSFPCIRAATTSVFLSRATTGAHHPPRTHICFTRTHTHLLHAHAHACAADETLELAPERRSARLAAKRGPPTLAPAPAPPPPPPPPAVLLKPTVASLQTVSLSPRHSPVVTGQAGSTCVQPRCSPANRQTAAQASPLIHPQKKRALADTTNSALAASRKQLICVVAMAAQRKSRHSCPLYLVADSCGGLT